MRRQRVHRSRSAAILAALTALVVLLGVVGAGPAPADEAGDPPLPAPGAVAVELCVAALLEVPEVGPRACKSLDSGAVILALLCGQTPLAPAACSTLTDGRDVDPASIDAFEDGWVHRALRLQSRLDEAEPLRRSLMAHTHNAGNSTAYHPTVGTADPNQRFSITDQMRMGSRAVEIDLHWTLHPTGSAATGGRAVVDCHGRSESVGPYQVHLGCSIDRLAEQSLAEVGAFLRAPGNEREVVLLYLENQLDGDPVAHDLAAEAIERQLGDLVARPSGEGCTALPVDTSRAELLAAGHQVLIVGNCGPGAWTTWVHERGPAWDERGNSAGYPSFPDCVGDRAARRYDERVIRVYEDSTWLSAMVGSGSEVTVDEVRSMVRCGVNLVGFDRLLPDDGRLEALVWSWAPGEPVADAGRCAAWDGEGRFRADECAEPRRFACRTGAGDWLVTEATGPWAEGFEACGPDATFAVPPSGWENERLRASAGEGELWLNLGDTLDAGWTPALGAAPPELGGDPAGDLDGPGNPDRHAPGPPPGGPGTPHGPSGPPPGRGPAGAAGAPAAGEGVVFAPVSATGPTAPLEPPAAVLAALLVGLVSAVALAHRVRSRQPT